MPESFAIAGSGFGLYGYLPALLEEIADAVVLPQAYEEKIRLRPELSRYLDRISWAPDLDDALGRASGVAIASTPARQEALASQCLRFNNIRRYILEKPLAPDAGSAKSLLDIMLRSGAQFRIGYTLLHAAWYEGLKARLQKKNSIDELSIAWTFHAHHFLKNTTSWKRSDSCGGGVLKFYGIQVLALLADLGYRRVAASDTTGARPGESEQWRAVFSGDGLPDVRVRVDSRSLNKTFSIRARAGAAQDSLVDLPDPFETSYADGRVAVDDRRIPVLRTLCRTFRSDDLPIYRLYGEAIALWARTEAATTTCERKYPS